MPGNRASGSEFEAIDDYYPLIVYSYKSGSELARASCSTVKQGLYLRGVGLSLSLDLHLVLLDSGAWDLGS